MVLLLVLGKSHAFSEVQARQRRASGDAGSFAIPLSRLEHR
jgi:hypothetical protein